MTKQRKRSKEATKALKKRILVTGGLGFIGHKVVEKLQAMKHSVDVVDVLTTYGMLDKEELEYLFDKISPERAVGKTLMKMPKDPDKVLTGMDYHVKGHHFNLKRSSLRKPCPTITAMGNLAGIAGTCHPIEDRKFTIKELKRIMSLPEDFKLTGQHKQQSERIGRMVPPLMMKALAESIYNKVLKPYKELNND